MRFDGFSPQAFEQLIQAIAGKVLGPGLVVFGRGPDGAREATFEGDAETLKGRQWSGYIVVQAKCRVEPRKDSTDATWLVAQLKSEFDRYENDPILRRPDYYLLCTNVELSAVAGVGGKDRVEDLFRKRAPALGIQDWHVWSPDELRVLLQNAEDVRRAYAAWITPSDILATLLEELVGPDPHRLLPLALARDLRNERDVRLRDAGQETDKPIYLEDVFVDLPVVLPEALWLGLDDATGSDLSAEYTESEVEPEDDNDQKGCVGLLLERSADRLTPDAEPPRRRRSRVGLPSRIVILGGPGQGKSTLSQFLVQYSRARLLRTLPDKQLIPETREAVERILRCAKELGLYNVGPARIPVRIDLPHFADTIRMDQESSPSLLSYIARRLSRDLDTKISVDTIRKLLGTLPWLVVLDGLDEVPPSANRQQVVVAINGFWDEVYSEGGDVMAVVTTRPQGYNHDLDPTKWQHWLLRPLHPDEAIGYARKLANIRLSDVQRRDAIIEDMVRACSDPATSLLTSSPLQVAILFGISYLKGSIPQDRWELFDRYYTLLRDREAQKPGMIGTFVRDNKRTIDAIHHDCGWVLQVAAENSGGTVAHLTPEQFQNIAVGLLEAEGFGNIEARELAKRLEQIATQRLVMLATRVDGQITFDVRSLQEYMAAAKMAGSHPERLDARLRAIATSAHWRHVFRISASKVFSIAELGHLRTMVVGICDALDKGDLNDGARIVRAGASLALDLLSDGVASGAPKFQRILAARALDTLGIGARADLRLTAISSIDGGDFAWEQLWNIVRRGSRRAAKQAFSLLLQISKERGWQEKVALELADSDASELIELLAGTDPRNWPPSAKQVILDAQATVGVDRTVAFMDRLPSEYLNAKESHGRGADACLLPPAATFAVEVERTSVKWFVGGATLFVPLSTTAGIWRNARALPESPTWRFVNACRGFAVEPSETTLGDALGAAIEAGTSHTGLSGHAVPWPLTAVLRDIEDGMDPSEAVRLARAGAFGDAKAWIAAEQRWASDGVTLEDVLTWSSGRYLSPDIGTVGAPFIRTITSRHKSRGTIGAPVREALEAIREGDKRDRLYWLAAVSAKAPDEEVALQYVDLFFDLLSQGHGRAARSMLEVHPIVWQDLRVLQFADRWGRSPDAVPMTKNVHPIIGGFNGNTSLRGLLPFIAKSVRLNSNQGRKAIAALSPTAYERMESDPPLVKAAGAFLNCVAGKWSERNASEFVEDLFAAWDGGLIRQAVLAVRSRPTGDPGRKVLVHRLLAHPNTADHLYEIALDTLASDISSTPTNLADPAEADRLELPMLPQ